MRLGPSDAFAAAPGDELTVFADDLQAQGDPRGELLALELASLRAPTPTRARALNREAQLLRAAEHELVWPSAWMSAPEGGGLGLSLRAGLVVELSLVGQPLERARQLCARPQAQWLDVALHVDPRAVSTVPSRLRLPEGPALELLEGLAELTGLRALEVPARLAHTHGALRILAEILPRQQTLEALVLPIHRRGMLPALSHLPALSELWLGQCARENLELLASFPALRRLGLGSLGPVTPDAERALVLALARLESLDSLSVGTGGSAPNWRDLLPLLKVRHLDLLHGQSFGDVWSWRKAHASLAEIEGLESLGMHGRFVSSELLARLSSLRSLELWGRESVAIARSRAPRLVLEGIEQLGCSAQWLRCVRVSGLERLRVHGETEPGVWSELAAAGVGAGLRELQLHRCPPVPVPKRALEVCAGLEHLYLDSLPSREVMPFIAALPSLRRLQIRELSPRMHRELSEALPSLLIERSSTWPQVRTRPRGQAEG